MQTTVLRLDETPPISVPMRFFLTAPAFALAAAALLAVHGSQTLISRWAPATIALTHLITLGFVTQVMIGALMQMLPVVAGAPLPRLRFVAWAVQLPLVFGTAAFAAGLWLGRALLLGVGVVLLGVGFFLFLAAAALALARVPQVHPGVTAMRLALGALALTVLLGIALGLERSGVPILPGSGRALADIHFAWGLVGWVTLLVIGSAYQVVPMFQLTAAYPVRLQRFLVPAIFVALLVSSTLHVLVVPAILRDVAALIVLAGPAVFALVTLRLQARRRRRQPDATTRFWQLGMASGLAAVANVVALPWPDEARGALLVGVLAIVGFASCVIHGMLYKIVPFLAWLHLHQRGIRCVLPNMKEILPDCRTLPHTWVHAAALLALCGAILAPRLMPAPAAGLLLALSYGWLGLNLHYALRVYCRSLHAPPAPTIAPHVD